MDKDSDNEQDKGASDDEEESSDHDNNDDEDNGHEIEVEEENIDVDTEGSGSEEEDASKDEEEEDCEAEADADDDGLFVEDDALEAIDCDHEVNENEVEEEEEEEEEEEGEEEEDGDKYSPSGEEGEPNENTAEDAKYTDGIDADVAAKIKSTGSDEDESVNDPRGPSYDDMLDLFRDGVADVCYHYRKDQQRVESLAFNNKAQRRKIGKISKNPDGNTLKWEAVGLNNGKKFVNGVEVSSNKEHSPKKTRGDIFKNQRAAPRMNDNEKNLAKQPVPSKTVAVAKKKQVGQGKQATQKNNVGEKKNVAQKKVAQKKGAQKRAQEGPGAKGKEVDKDVLEDNDESEVDEDDDIFDRVSLENLLRDEMAQQ